MQRPGKVRLVALNAPFIAGCLNHCGGDALTQPIPSRFLFWSIVSDVEEIRHLRDSVVTQLCLDYGLIDDAVYFTGAEVLGGILLREGDLVSCIAVRDGARGGWKALRVSGLCLVKASACTLCLPCIAQVASSRK